VTDEEKTTDPSHAMNRVEAENLLTCLTCHICTCHDPEAKLSKPCVPYDPNLEG
jgi:hypothetical protein